jgi:hypothetical protein
MPGIKMKVLKWNKKKSSSMKLLLMKWRLPIVFLVVGRKDHVSQTPKKYIATSIDADQGTLSNPTFLHENLQPSA